MSTSARGGWSPSVLLMTAVVLSSSFAANCGGDRTEDDRPCILACSNHGTCEWSDGVQTCVCDPGYGGDRCSTCAEGYYPYADDCVAECPAGTFADGDVCTPCEPYCETCTDATSCTTCVRGYVADNGECRPYFCEQTAPRLAAGTYHTCVLLSNGNVDCYGNNEYGQGEDYLGGDAIGVATGTYHTCVLLSNGNVDCYGDTACGQSKDYFGGDAVGVAAGRYHTCVLLSSGNVNCYGGNYYHQGEDYLVGDASTDCPVCEPHCEECTSATTCTSCRDGYYLHAGTCVTDCPPGTFADGSNCPVCEPHCDVCTDATTCTTCSAGYYLDAADCIACEPHCDACTNLTTCTICTAGYTLGNGDCLAN